VTYLLRFFLVALPMPMLMVGTFAAMATVGALVLLVDAGHGTAAVTPVLVLQLFAASSGFAIPARRGHYDLLLTRGEGRLRVAFAHWVSSAAPGVVGWFVVGLIELAASGGTRSVVFSAGTCAALALLSTLPWALSIRLPRFAPSIAWLLVLVIAATSAPTGVAESWLRDAGTAGATSAAAAVFLLYPLSVVGRDLGPSPWLIVAPALIVAACAMLASCRWIAHADFPLEAAQ
jgi:hypothetical protein